MNVILNIICIHVFELAELWDRSAHLRLKAWRRLGERGVVTWWNFIVDCLAFRARLKQDWIYMQHRFVFIGNLTKTRDFLSRATILRTVKLCKPIAMILSLICHSYPSDPQVTHMTLSWTHVLANVWRSRAPSQKLFSWETKNCTYVVYFHHNIG